MSDPVTRIKAKVRLEFTATAGRDMSRFLTSLLDARIVGRRCPSCLKVYVPPRGPCPTCGVFLGDDVELPHVGTVTTFCTVNVPFEGQVLKLPYVLAWVLLDGADLAFLHLIQGIEAADVRMGMRVRAVFAPKAERTPSLEAIRWFEPTSEPDAPYEAYSAFL